MKKLIFTLTMLIMLAGIIGADISTSGKVPVTANAQKKPCYGYTIVEFGKGINCYGDTVKLVKVNGGQQMVVNEINPNLTAKN